MADERGRRSDHHHSLIEVHLHLHLHLQYPLLRDVRYDYCELDLRAGGVYRVVQAHWVRRRPQRRTWIGVLLPWVTSRLDWGGSPGPPTGKPSTLVRGVRVTLVGSL